MPLRLALSTKSAVSARVRLGALFAMPDSEFAEKVRRIEGHPVFQKLMALSVVRLKRFPRPRAPLGRLFPELRGPGPVEWPDPLEGDEGLKRLIQKIGQDLFSRCFLSSDELSDAERAYLCGISMEEAAKLRAVVDSAYIQAEFEQVAGDQQPAPQTNLVGGIEVEAGRPVIAFYRREIWKGRYRIDESLRRRLREMLGAPEARQAELLLNQVSFLNRRAAALFRILQALVDFQAEYLREENTNLLKSLSQRALARAVGISSGALSMLIRGRSIRLPSGREVELKTLLPGRKSILKDRLYCLSLERPDFTDEQAAHALVEALSLRITPRSIGRYRKELGLASFRQRASTGFKFVP